MNSASAAQLTELMQYMSSQMRIPISGGYAPVGTIISFMGTTAPQDYLPCDGTIYNIDDYSQLASFFATQFGASNYFGGNGTTTFAVPDLRGEFLRGTGTNSHTNQGNGANVGDHQDATKHAYEFMGGSNNAIDFRGTVDGSGYIIDQNRDTTYRVEGDKQVKRTGDYPVEDLGSGNTSYTSRPTNTSILWCIKAVAVEGGYSTNEKIVGTWVDGKPLYQRTFTGTITGVTDKQLTNITVVDIPSIERAVDCWGYCYGIFIPSAWVNNSNNYYIRGMMDGTTLKIQLNRDSLNNKSYWITLQYTKSTD